jgi:hypothetical protein
MYDGHNTYIVGNVNTIRMQGSNVRIYQPFVAKVRCCRSGDVTTIDELVDVERKGS